MLKWKKRIGKKRKKLYTHKADPTDGMNKINVFDQVSDREIRKKENTFADDTGHVFQPEEDMAQLIDRIETNSFQG